MASLALAFDILARDKTSAAFRSAGDGADGFGKKLKNVGRIASVAIGGAAVTAVAGLGAAMVGGIKDAISYETLQKKTAAVIKSTGNVANISSKGIQNLAGKLETLSGVDEELIINGQNVLATFTKVRNETGKGNKIFDKATAAALDLSVAMGTDLQSANTMVGKALNDPIAGLTSLTRAGIQFTDQQKEQIKAMVESGDVLGAQKVILGELETQIGGTAKAAGSGLAGDMARLKDAWDDAFRSLATALLPTLTDFAAWLSDKLPVAIEAAKTAFGTLKEWWDTNGPAILEVVTVLKDGVVTAFEKVIEAGEFVIDHWDQFKILAGAMALAIAGYYVALAAAATSSAGAQAIAWVGMKATAIASKIETGAIVALMIADWARLAVASVRHSNTIAASWLRAAGPFGLAIGGAAWVAEQGPDAPGGHTGKDRWTNPFDGIKFGFGLPWGDDGGVWPGPKGVHSLGWVAGGETLVPTHKPGVTLDSGSSGFDAVGEDQLLTQRRLVSLIDEQNGILRAMTGASIAQSRGMSAVMG